MSDSAAFFAQDFAPMPRRRRLSLEERRAELVQVGTQIYRSRSFDDVSTDEIARAAGVSQGLLFHYFPSKVAFFAACLEGQAQELLSSMFGHAEERGEVVWDVAFETYFDDIERNGPRFPLRANRELSASPEVAQVVADFRSAVLKQVHDSLPPYAKEHATYVRLALKSWQGGVEAAVLHWLEYRDVSRRELGHHFARTLLAALSPVYG